MAGVPFSCCLPISPWQVVLFPMWPEAYGYIDLFKKSSLISIVFLVLHPLCAVLAPESHYLSNEPDACKCLNDVSGMLFYAFFTPCCHCLQPSSVPSTKHSATNSGSITHPSGRS